jgi:hypothetical protein
VPVGAVQEHQARIDGNPRTLAAQQVEIEKLLRKVSRLLSPPL